MPLPCLNTDFTSFASPSPDSPKQSFSLGSLPQCYSSLGCDLDTFDSAVDSPENTYANVDNVKVLMENGDADFTVTEEQITAWKDEMDLAGVDWVWYVFP